MSVTYTGMLYGIETEAYPSLARTVEPESGRRYITVESAVIGIIDGVGLVTADSREDLREAIIRKPPAGVRWERCSRVYYRRRRIEHGSDLWNHKVADGRCWIGIGTNGEPVAVVEAPTAAVCDMQGAFICGG